MTFVRWHYRDGAYVRSHYRRGRSTPSAAQMTLIAAGILGVVHATVTPNRPRRHHPRRSVAAAERMIDRRLDQHKRQPVGIVDDRFDQSPRLALRRLDDVDTRVAELGAGPGDICDL